MIKIAISEAAFEAIIRTMPVGSVGYENAVDEHGQRMIWLNWAVVDRLGAMRGPGESMSDVILRLAAEGRAAGGSAGGSEANVLHSGAALASRVKEWHEKAVNWRLKARGDGAGPLRNGVQRI